MQKLAEICIKRPVFAAMIILSLVVVGASSYFKLGVDRFPAVDIPTVTVRASLPGASPEEAESVLAQTMEEVVNTVEGVEELRSVSSQGRSFVMATFNLNRNIEDAAQDIRDRVQGVTRLFPPGTDPPIVQKFDNERQGIMTISLSSNRSIRELSELAENVVKKQLERSSGVGKLGFGVAQPARSISGQTPTGWRLTVFPSLGCVMPLSVKTPTCPAVTLMPGAGNCRCGQWGV